MNSLERAIGQLEGIIKLLVIQVESVDKKVDSLPCITHELKICALEAWTAKQNGKATEDLVRHNIERIQSTAAIITGKFRVKTALIYAGFGFAGGLITFLATLLTGCI